MKAIILKQTGGVENLVHTNLPTPSIKDNEVLVNVKAIALNPVDVYVRANENALKYVLGLTGDEEYSIIGWDISGVVTETGSAVSEFKTGDEVFGMVNFRGQGKAYAEYVAVPEDQLALKPANVSHEEAAGATLAALTAYQALVNDAKLQAGEKVLISAAAGGVGYYAVQIAKHIGAHIIGTASAPNKDFVLGLGADEFIDYQTQAFEELVTDGDVVIDAIRDPEHLKRSLKSVKNGGRLISLITYFDNDEINEKVAAKNVYANRLWVASSGEDMAALAGLLEKGIVKTHISHTFGFEDMDKAHLQVETGRGKGKVVVTV
jgi:NADPH:quinone reductase-like Zn-dependent oxidoreductase